MRVPLFLVMALLSTSVSQAQADKTYVGVVTDTMCMTDHTAMKVAPDSKCVQECVRDARTFRYALSDGNGVYTLSDQQRPAAFAGRKVKITGVLYTKTNILKVNAIAAAD
jgi:hypothetical protein